MDSLRTAARAGRSRPVLWATLSFCIGIIAAVVGGELPDPWSTLLIVGGGLLATIGFHLGAELQR